MTEPVEQQQWTAVKGLSMKDFGHTSVDKVCIVFLSFKMADLLNVWVAKDASVFQRVFVHVCLCVCVHVCVYE